MARQAISDDARASVLLRSRRRCCICFGLNRDTGLKAGQIAHLDQNATNNSTENLAFLCLEHHDEYDSITRQRKGLTLVEAKAFRRELYERLEAAMGLPVHFGEIAIPPADPIAGVWIRDGEWSSAEITITPLSDNLEGSARYAVTGLALWGKSREFGPNLGELSFIGRLYQNEIYRQKANIGGEPYTMLLRFEGQAMLVEEQNWLTRYGMGVDFNGSYRRVQL